MIELLQNLRSQVSEGSRHQIDNILESVRSIPHFLL